MLTDIAKKRLKKGKRKQYLSYDEIQISTNKGGVVAVSMWSKGECISTKQSGIPLQLGDTYKLSNLIGELEVNLQIIKEP